MYTSTMNSDELYEEYLRDSEEIGRRYRGYLSSSKFKVLRRDGQRFPIRKTIEIKLSSGNLYLLAMTIPDRKSLFRSDFPVNVSALLNEYNGHSIITFATRVGTKKPQIMKMVPHLLSRYKERLHLDIEGIELMKHFIESCPIFNITIEDYETGECLVSTINGAISGRCKREKKTYSFTLLTFVSDETIERGKRKECIDQYNEILDDNIDYFPQITKSARKAIKMYCYRK